MTQYQEINAAVNVILHSGKGKPQIISFHWNDKDYQVEQTTLISRARKGREAVWLFNVATKSGAYKLRLNSDSLSWELVEISWEE